MQDEHLLGTDAQPVTDNVFYRGAISIFEEVPGNIIWYKQFNVLAHRYLVWGFVISGRCPPKSGTLDFCYFDIRYYYSIFSFHQIKRLSSEKNDTKIIWFDSVILILQQFLKHSHLRILLNLCEIFTAGIAVNITSALCQKGINSVLPYARRALTLWDSHWVKALLA